MVAGKLNPTVGKICFCRIFQTVMNLEKRTTEMSSEGPKMVEKELWVGLKWPENTKIGRPKFAAAAAFAGPIRARSAAAGRKILPAWSSGRPPHPSLACVQ